MAGAGERVAAVVIDGLLGAAALVASAVLLGLLTSFASERWQLGGLAANGVPQQDTSSGDLTDFYRVDVPWWLTVLTLAFVAVVVTALSGAWSRQDRRSFGQQLGHVSLVPAALAAPDADHDLDGAALPQPARWRVALRWLVPLAVFVVAEAAGSTGTAVVLVLLGWLPALVGGHRSVYDRVAGLTVARVTFTRERAAA